MLTLIERSLSILTKLLQRDAAKAQAKHEALLKKIDSEDAQYRGELARLAEQHGQRQCQLKRSNVEVVARHAKCARLAARIQELNEV